LGKFDSAQAAYKDTKPGPKILSRKVSSLSLQPLPFSSAFN
jgi:hypothetical protein